jgi:hypothetical protein
MGNFIVEETHISNIRIGDTIMHNGVMTTVSGTNIKHDSFMGKTLFGDSYHSGYKPVQRVTFLTKL